MKDHEINRRDLINTTAVGATAGRWAFLEKRRGGWAEGRLD